MFIYELRCGDEPVFICGEKALDLEAAVKDAAVGSVKPRMDKWDWFAVLVQRVCERTGFRVVTGTHGTMQVEPLYRVDYSLKR
jgi:hypothetical protein